MEDTTLGPIRERYSGLAESACCLSCGGAVNRSDPKPGEVCLDLGSGRGADVLRLADAVGSTGYVYGVDISDGMLEKARRNARKLGVENAAFLQSTLDALPFGEETVDLVISNCTINHAPDKRAVWREVYRVLRQGGRFVVSDIYSLGEVPAEYRNDPEAVAECWAGSIPRETWLETVRSAGFTNIEILEESAPYPKGAVTVASFTVAGRKPARTCHCGRR
ncbi:MAG: methyltransferase domain-containing protein [Candidatus Latescibacterota bacterium]